MVREGDRVEDHLKNVVGDILFMHKMIGAMAKCMEAMLEDKYSRVAAAGILAEAQEFLKDMPVESAKEFYEKE